MYIKIIILSLIASIWSGINLNTPYVSCDILFCLSVAFAFCDKNKIRAIIVSAVLAVVAGAYSDRLMLWCVVEYVAAAYAVACIFKKNTKLDFIWAMLVSFVFTFAAESIYSLISEGMSFYTVLEKSVAAVLTELVAFIVVNKLINPKKRSYRITVE